MAILTEVQIAAALAEQVYRRNVKNFQVKLSDLGRDVEALRVTAVEAARQGNTLTYSDGFYYNINTGFVAEFVRVDGTYYIVFRGTDSAESALKSAFNGQSNTPG
jgi:hypothetical protein